MSDSRALLGQIRDLRQRLTGVHDVVDEANATAAALLAGENQGDQPLDAHLAAGARRQALLDASIRQLAEETSSNEVRPTRLIGKVRQQLERGRALVARLKALTEDPLISQGDPDVNGDDDSLLQAYRGAAAMTESTLRLVQAFPDAPSAQIRLGDGLEHILDAVADRIGALAAAVAQRRGELNRRDALAGLLCRLHAGGIVDLSDLEILADFLLSEVKQSAPLRFLSAPATRPADFLAAHGITCARVLARLIRHDPDLQPWARDAVIAALVKDVGMLSADAQLLAHDGPLSDEQKRAVEAHCRAGAERVARLLPVSAAVCEAIAAHHERLDGSGYPAGLRQAHIGPLARLLAVADVYTALCSPRPHRPPLDPRTALTETLLLADRGQLDRDLAERLLRLSFYPVGSVVEMNDGAIGLVVATHAAPCDPHAPARPVVAILTDVEGQLLPAPRHVDLADCEGRSVVRALPAQRRRQILARRYPELA